MMPSATDFLPSYIRLFMNFASTMSPYLASGVTSRFSARWRRDIVGSFVSSLLWIPARARFAWLAGMTATRSLRPFCSVHGAALFAVLDALRIEHAAQDVITNARQILDAAAADQHHRVLLQIVAFARDVTHHLVTVGEANFRDLAQGRVRLLWRRRVDPCADASLFRIG